MSQIFCNIAVIEKMIKKINIKTNQRNEIIDITHLIEPLIENGLIIIYVPHTTCAVTINESADNDVKIDFLKKLNSLIPEDENYLHSEGNSDSHIKTSLIGNSVTLIVEKGNLILGTWQSIWFCEFDGPRNRNIILKYVKE
jgi:secondary thiamine-phosphate synthase enzyme